jgi:hypothetical protein
MEAGAANAAKTPIGEFTIFEDPVVTVIASNIPAEAAEISIPSIKNTTVYMYKAGLLNQYLISFKNIFKNM